MTYCELWLESEGGMSSLRVALLAPDEYELPEGFIISESQVDQDKKLYYSEVLDGIMAAKKAIDKAAEFYSERDLKFLYYREIRKPTIS